jgi:peptidoglycan hydrolase-like protein with peptidoglycan-binding domain
MKLVYSLITAALAATAIASTSAADNLYVDADTVRKVQKTLNDRGFRTGGVDGRMGPQTQAALVNFQRAEKLQPTGKLDRQTLSALGVQKNDAAAGGTQQKYSPATIRKVQETLNARGYKAGAPNGILGESTRSALRAFQKSENIVVTGSLNPRTLARLGINDPRAASGGSRSRNSNAPKGSG